MRHVRNPAAMVTVAFCVLAAGTLTACGGDSNHSAAPQTQVLHSFGNETSPIVGPYPGLVLGKDGNFYGTALGGDHNGGVVFKVTPAGVESIMHSFDPSTGDGSQPSSLILGSDGNFYGTTSSGGTNDRGTVFKMTPGGTESVLYSFKGYPSDAGNAIWGLVEASDGNFYGTADAGGPDNKGAVFKVSPSGIETVLYFFGSVADDPAGSSPLVQGDDGNFYGVSAYGGAAKQGTVFKVTAEGIVTLVHSFTGGSNDGMYPVATGLLKRSDGNFYGVTSFGGPHGGGVVYKLTPAGNVTIVYAFDSSDDSGSRPEGALAEDSDGNLYVSTSSGGYPRTETHHSGTSLSGRSGTIFEITAAGKATLLSNFGPADADGTSPSGPPILAQDGNLYGVTSSGGAHNAGVFYKITR